jgi:O-acetylhomoserine/O-acetylserine sulfhydrylase-like pyridoxal-dependent enzyme
MKFNTKTIHGGQHNDPTTGAVMPAIFQTTFAQTSPGNLLVIMFTVGLLIQPEQH